MWWECKCRSFEVGRKKEGRKERKGRGGKDREIHIHTQFGEISIKK